MSDELFPKEDDDRILIAKGQTAAFFPDQPSVTRWADAEKDEGHKAINVGPDAACSCGWKAGPDHEGGWTSHFISVNGLQR